MADDDDMDEGPGGPVEDMPQLDEKGFPIIMGVQGGKVAAKDNPLRALAEAKKKKEEVRTTDPQGGAHRRRALDCRWGRDGGRGAV
jgi:hypothetical protein